ncbi:unnamed protein product, partial [Sphenostylis stenocarpa]
RPGPEGPPLTRSQRLKIAVGSAPDYIAITISLHLNILQSLFSSKIVTSYGPPSFIIIVIIFQTNMSVA